MSIYEKLQDGLNDGLAYGIETSKQFIKKAKETAAELEEAGLLKIEIHKLNNRKKDLINELGIKAYEAFIVNEKKSLTQSSAVKEIINEIIETDALIADKEQDLKQAE